MKILGATSGIIFQNLHEILSDNMVSVYFLDMFLASRDGVKVDRWLFGQFH